MRRFVIPILLLLFFTIGINAQNIVKGIIVDSDSEKPLEGVSLSIKDNVLKSYETNKLGVFVIENLDNGNFILEIKLPGYETQNFPLELAGNTIDLVTILLYLDISEEEDLSTVTLSDDELNDDTSAADNISGLLQSSRDVYLSTAAFEFSSSFFRIRGLDSENGKVLLME